VESDVNATLSELERKLKELERELESVGRSGELDSEPAQGGWTPPADPVVDASTAAPPPGATPFTASWHGSGPAAAPPPPPASPYNGAPPVRVTPPPAPWDAAEQAPPPPAWSPAPPPPPAAAWPPPPSPAAPPPGTGSGLHRQLDELLAFRDRLVRTTDELVSELSRVLTELGVDAPDPAATVLTGRVVVEAAPFGDLATLSAFEQALMRVPGVAGVHVRSLDAGRAVIDVQLAGPVALGAALRATATVAFSVSDARDGQLTVALHP
jgi:hypothetical protein